MHLISVPYQPGRKKCTITREKLRAYYPNIYTVKRSIATAKTREPSKLSFFVFSSINCLLLHCISKVKEGKLVIFRFPNVSEYILDNTNWFSSSVHIWLI